MKDSTQTFSEILKFNPYHGKNGRFTGSGAASSFTWKPGSSAAHDKAIEREKERMGAAGTAESKKGDGKHLPETIHSEMNIDGKTYAIENDIITYNNQKYRATESYTEASEHENAADTLRRANLPVQDYVVVNNQLLCNRKVAETAISQGKEAYENRMSNMSRNVPGYKELSDALENNNSEMDRFLTSIDRGDIKITPPNKQNTDAMREKYPRASAYITAEGYSLSANYSKSSAGVKAMEQIRQGGDVDAIMGEMKSWLNKSYYPPSVLFIGIHISGVPEEILVDGGEEEEDLHVTLLYGSFTPQADKESIKASVNKAVQKIRPLIPDTVWFDRTGMFDASEGSDGKNVIYARVSPGQLEEAREMLVSTLKREGIEVHHTFSEYKPHMTLAYIDPDEDFPLHRMNVSATADQFLIGIGEDEQEEKETTWKIVKADSDKRLVFGWANVAVTREGKQVQDFQNDIIDPDDLEDAVYKYVLNFRDAGEEHIKSLRKKARMVESVIFTEEKLKAMKIPKGTVPLGWWIGFYVDDDAAWEKIKNGTYKMFSIEGTGTRVPVDEKENLAKSFAAIFRNGTV